MGKFELVVLEAATGEVEDILTDPGSWAKIEKIRDEIMAPGEDDMAQDPDYFPILMIRPYED